MHGLVALFLEVITLAIILLLIGLAALIVFVVTMRMIMASIVLMVVIGLLVVVIALVTSIIVALVVTILPPASSSIHGCVRQEDEPSSSLLVASCPWQSSQKCQLCWQLDTAQKRR